MYFKSGAPGRKTLTVNGIAQTNERISELLRNTAYNAQWLVRPELVEIKVANVQTASRTRAARLFEFTMRISMKRPPESSPEGAGSGRRRPRRLPRRPRSPEGTSMATQAKPERRPELRCSNRRPQFPASIPTSRGSGPMLPKLPPPGLAPRRWWSWPDGSWCCPAPTTPRRRAREGGRSRQDYRTKLAQAVNLGELRKQKLQVEEYVTQLEKQLLPGKAEMDALLSDINQAGLGRGLQFELFRPARWS